MRPNHAVSAAWWTIGIFVAVAATSLLWLVGTYLRKASSTERHRFAASALRVVTWPLFIVALLIAAELFYCAATYVANPTMAHRSDLTIVWFGVAAYGFVPLLLLTVVAILRYRSIGSRRAAVLLTPPLDRSPFHVRPA